MSNTNALDYFLVLLAAYEALHEGTSLVEVQKVTEELRAMNDFVIRSMRPQEIPIAIDWAAAEGWNPGLADAECFSSVDAHGFLIGELDGRPAATISCVNYDDRFSFLGFFVSRLPCCSRCAMA